MKKFYNIWADWWNESCSASDAECIPSLCLV